MKAQNKNPSREIDEDEMDEIVIRVWRKIEICMLANNPKFLKAIGIAGGGRGIDIARRSPPASGDNE